jgi:hypothetical protein
MVEIVTNNYEEKGQMAAMYHVTVSQLRLSFREN